MSQHRDLGPTKEDEYEAILLWDLASPAIAIVFSRWRARTWELVIALP